MGAVVVTLRVLRLVLLGGALSVLWLLLTATDSSATPAGDDRSLPLVGQGSVVRDLAGTARSQEHTKHTASRAGDSPAPTPKSLPVKATRAVTQPVESTVSDVVASVDSSVERTQRVGSTAVEAATSTTTAVASVPVVAPVAKPVADAVVPAVLSVTKDLSTTAFEPVRSIVRDVVAGADDVVEVVAPAEDAVASVVSGAATPGASTRDTVPTTTGSSSSETGPVVVQAWGSRQPAGFEKPRGAADDRSVATGVDQRAAGDRARGDLPAPAPPVGSAPGCALGASAGAGGQLDKAAYRGAIAVPVATTLATGGSGHTASVPGPSVLPGFSPE